MKVVEKPQADRGAVRLWRRDQPSSGGPVRRAALTAIGCSELLTQSYEHGFGRCGPTTLLGGDEGLPQTYTAVAAGNLGVSEYPKTLSLQVPLKVAGEKAVLKRPTT